MKNKNGVIFYKKNYYNKSYNKKNYNYVLEPLLHLQQILLNLAGQEALKCWISFPQPLRPWNQLHHPLDVTGPFVEVGGGLGGIALQRIGETGGNEGGLSG